MSKKRLNLSGVPSLDDLLSEALRQGLEVKYVNRTGEVKVRAPWGYLKCNVRRKDGNRALLALLREGQKAEDAAEREGGEDG